jgi:hypothetical protein
LKLGIDATAWVNTATWDSPSWAEMDFIEDLDEATDWDVAEIKIRRSLVKQGAKTMVDIGVSAKMLREPDNSTYLRILNALRTRDTVDVMFLDGDIDEDGAEGIRYIAQVVSGGGSQNSSDALYRDIVFKPFPSADPDEVPQWASYTTTGGLDFTPITPED